MRRHTPPPCRKSMISRLTRTSRFNYVFRTSQQVAAKEEMVPYGMCNAAIAAFRCLADAQTPTPL